MPLPGTVDSPAVAPRQLLEQSLARCDALGGYEVMFYARERTGRFGGLSEWHQIKAYFRKSPAAIKWVWLNSDSEYTQAIYTQGINHDKVMLLPRHGFFGMSPHPIAIAPQTAVTLGKTLWPITDFGMANLIRLTLGKIQQADRLGGAKIIYAGMDAPPDMQEAATHIIILYPKGLAEANRQDIYINEQTGYPVASYLWKPGGDLLAAYLYGEPQSPAPPAGVFRLTSR